MRQDRKSEAGKYQHNDAEHPVWVVDRRICSLICFVLQCGPKRYLTPQFLRFSFVLDRIVHLPVPSEIFTGRGKKIFEIFAADSDNAGLTWGLAGNAAAKRRRRTEQHRTPACSTMV
jgi:hypothetical protein